MLLHFGQHANGIFLKLPAGWGGWRPWLGNLLADSGTRQASVQVRTSPSAGACRSRPSVLGQTDGWMDGHGLAGSPCWLSLVRTVLSGSENSR